MYVCINMDCCQVTDNPNIEKRELTMAGQKVMQDFPVCPKCGDLLYKRTRNDGTNQENNYTEAR